MAVSTGCLSRHTHDGGDGGGIPAGEGAIWLVRPHKDLGLADMERTIWVRLQAARFMSHRVASVWVVGGFPEQ